jgi:tetratricopeptide (TPR) repeat protein
MQSDFSDHPNVMVSSTYSDLTAHREAVCDALLRLGFFPVGMEYDSAKAGTDVIASSLNMVSTAHAYIGILSHRYGGVPLDPSRNPNELSITELEYRKALERGVPVFMFLMDDEHPVKKGGVEPIEAYQAKLQALINDARARSICPTFSSVEELTSRVLQSMSDFRMQLMLASRASLKPLSSKRSRVRLAPPHLLAIPNFISGHDFVGRHDELAWLDDWSAGNSSLLVIEAIGGEGKSTLCWEWLNKQTAKVRPPFAGFLWYSFYEGGADMAAFASSAYAYVTGLPYSEFRGRKVAELGRLLAAALRERAFLLVLDGLERVLVAYHRLDASQARDDEVASGKDDRACIKPADGDLLRQLVAVNPSKILITSRLLPTALLNKSGQLLPGAAHQLLGGLHSDDALTMMRSVGVKGNALTIQQYLKQNFDNHPQIVGIVAGLVKDYVRQPGNFDSWAEDPQAGAALHLSKLDLVQRQTHILASALSGLDPGVRQVLSRIAALGSAVGFETVEALNPYMPPPLKVNRSLETMLANAVSMLQWREEELKTATEEDLTSLTDRVTTAQARVATLEAEQAAESKKVEEYRTSEEVCEALPRLVSALRDLEQRGLLQWDRQKNTYDLHPVVRGYAFDVLEQPERLDICDRIADHFRSKPKDRYSETKTLADVQQSMNIFRALIQAGRFVDAMWFYRGDFANALSYAVEAYHEILALLRPLFPRGFTQPPDGFSVSEQSYLLNNASVALIMLGRLTEAHGALICKLRLNLDSQDTQNLRICLTNLGETLRDQNKLAEAHQAFELALQIAKGNNNSGAIARGYWHLMTTCRITGQFDKAEAAYREFRKLPTPTDREIYRTGDAEGERCWLKFYQGKLTDPELDDANSLAATGNNRTTLRSLVQLRGELALQRGAPGQSITAFESAIEMAQTVGLDVGGSEARLALANARAGDHKRAIEICERLHELEKPPHAELACAYLELGLRDRARQHALAGTL